MRLHPGPAVLLVVLLSTASCGDATGTGTTDTGGGEATSTTGVPTTSAPETTTTAPGTTTTIVTTAPGTQPTPAAADMAGRIVAAARDRDFRQLAELALEGDTMFNASFGQDFTDPAELAGYWRGLEESGEPIADTMVGLLGLPMFSTKALTSTGAEVEIFVSPRVMSDDATRQDRADLDEVLGPERVAGWFADGMYLGYRIGIDATGDWRFFVIGD